MSFVGRGDELRILDRALDDAAQGRTRVVVLTGEAGIGKTALAFEVARRAEERTNDARIGAGRAWEGGGAPAFFLWRECLRELGEDLALPATIARDESRFAALADVAERVRAIARTAPLTVLVIDDAQWADVPSLHALKLLARTARSERLCVVATVREPNDAAPDVLAALADVRREAMVLALGGLERTAIAELARSRGLDDDTAIDALARAGGGNALFVLELLADREARAAMAEGRMSPAPRGVREILTRHLDRLDDRARSIIPWAAVGGHPIDPAEIAEAAALGPEDVATAIEHACREHVLVRDTETLRFAHDLFRAAAYDEIPADRRTAMHAAFARALAGRESRAIARVQHLFAATPNVDAVETAMLALDAARAAVTRFAYEDAASLATRAATVFERRERRPEHALALALLAEATLLRGDAEASARIAEQAIAIARASGDAMAFARAVLALGMRRVIGPSGSALAAALDEAVAKLDAAGVDDAALRCAVEARLAAALQPLIDPPRALATARRAIERAREGADSALLARTIHAARPAFRMLEPLSERTAMDREFLALAEKLGDRPLSAHALARVYWTAIERGDALEAETTLLGLETVARELSLPNHELAAGMARCVREIMFEHYAEAEAIIGELDATRDRWLPASATGWLIDPVAILRYNLFLVRGGAVPDLPTAIPGPVATMMRLGILTRTGRIEEAAQSFAPLADMLLSGEVVYMTRTMVGDICARVGARSHATRFYELLLPFEGRHHVWTPLPGYGGAIDRLLGSLARVRGDRTTAVRHYDSAIAMEESLGAIAFAAQSRAERADIAPASVAVPKTVAAPALTREGETWRVTFGEESTRVKDADGLRYLAFLLARPHLPVSVVELFGERASARGETAPPSGDAGDVLDRDAIAAYRARAKDLRDAMEEAEARADRGAVERARGELAFLEDELTRGVGLGGRARRASSDQEKIRINVTTRIRKSIDKLRAEMPALARHLDRSVKTGAICSYDPQ